jgi:hypothetical protein
MEIGSLDTSSRLSRIDAARRRSTSGASGSASAAGPVFISSSTLIGPAASAEASSCARASS